MFCNRWRDLGGKVYLSKRFALGHVGAFLFSEAAQARVLSSMMVGNSADASAASVAEAAPEFGGAPAADDSAPDVEVKRAVKPRRSTRGRKGA